DLQLDPVAVRIAIVHGRGRPVIDAAKGHDTQRLEPHVVVEGRPQGRGGEGAMVQARRLGGVDEASGQYRSARGQWSGVDEGDPMMLVVVGDEAETWVLVDDLRVERRAVPVAHGTDLVRLEHEVGELGRW